MRRVGSAASTGLRIVERTPTTGLGLLAGAATARPRVLGGPATAAGVRVLRGAAATAGLGVLRR
ncbi:hypothetical protein, partial [Saccharothrix lopnurensis]